MINITKLYCGIDTTGDPLRYGHTRGPGHGTPHATERAPHNAPPSARERRPVVSEHPCPRKSDRGEYLSLQDGNDHALSQ